MSDDPRRARQAQQARQQAQRRPDPSPAGGPGQAPGPGGVPGLGRRSLLGLLAGGAAAVAAGYAAFSGHSSSSTLPIPEGQSVGPEYLAATLRHQKAPTAPMPEDGRTWPSCVAAPGGAQGAGDLDLALAIDTTGSMGSVLNDVKHNLQKLVGNLRATGGSVRIGIIGYKDVCDREIVRVLPLTAIDGGGLTTVSAFIDGLQASGGCDWPEKMLAALEAATSMDWRGTAHSAIVVIADAPAHPQDERATLAIAEAFRTKIPGALVSLVDTGSGAHPFMAAVPQSGGGQYVTYDGHILNSLFPAITGCPSVN